MLRSLYRCVLFLHPPSFRKRFGNEMLSIFDQESKTSAAFGLIIEALISLLRQWILRPEFQHRASPMLSAKGAPDDVPSFSTLDPFRPRPGAVIHGMALSVTLFCLMCFAIRYSWIHVLRVHIPELQFEIDSSIHPSVSPSAFRGKPGSSPERNRTVQGVASAPLPTDPMPIEVDNTLSPFEASRETHLGSSASEVRHPILGTTIQIRLQSYSGIYVCKSPGITISITTQDGHLEMEIAGQPKRALSPVSETEFIVDGTSDAKIEFSEDNDGKFRQLQLFQGGQQFTAQRR